MDLDLDSLQRHGTAGIALNRRYTLGSLQERRAAYMGLHRASESGQVTVQADPRNTYAAWVGYFLPLVAAGCPKYRETTKVAEFRELVERHADALNALVQKQRRVLTNQALAVDYALGHAAAVVYARREPKADKWLRGREPGQPGYGVTEAYWPVVRRLEPKDLVWDADLLDEEDWRWTAHLEIRDMRALRRERREDKVKWDLAVAKESIYEPSESRVAGGGGDENALVAWWAMHVRDCTASDVRQLGYSAKDKDDYGNGYIFHLASSRDGSEMKAQLLRPPEPWYGPHDGPHVMFGALPVPGTSYRQSPLAANQSAIEQRARYERAVNLAGERYKRVIVCDSVDSAEALKDADHDGIVVVPSLATGGALSLERWGINEQMLANLERLIATEDLALGLSEEARGKASANTATAASLAAGATTQRMGAIVSTYVEDGQNRIARKQGWWVWNDDRFVISLGATIYDGGAHPLISWDDVQSETDFYSVRYMSEQRQQEMLIQYVEMVQGLIPSLVPGIPPASFMQVDEVLERLEEYGLKGAEGAINWAGLQGATALALQQQLQAAEPTPEARGRPVSGANVSRGTGRSVRENVSYAGQARASTGGAKRPGLNGKPQTSMNGAKPMNGSKN